MASLATSQDWKKAFFSLWKFCKKVKLQIKMQKWIDF
jgi:hypothetical protein